MLTRIIKYKLFAPLLATSMVIFTSCDKSDKRQEAVEAPVDEEVVTVGGKFGPTDLLEYYDFMIKKTNALIGIKTTTTKETQTSDRETVIDGYCFNTTDIPVSKGNIEIGTRVLSADPLANNRYFFSRKTGINDYSGVNVAIKLPGNQTGTFYVPTDISIDTGAPNTITVGKVLTWNADANNPRGVVIILEYDPTNLTNLTMAGTSPLLIRRAITTDDDGSYQFTSTDLAPFPVGGTLLLSVGRANFKDFKPKLSTETYSLYSYTVSEGLYLLQ